MDNLEAIRRHEEAKGPILDAREGRLDDGGVLEQVEGFHEVKLGGREDLRSSWQRVAKHARRDKKERPCEAAHCSGLLSVGLELSDNPRGTLAI